MIQHFAEFYHEGTTGKIIPACGSDAHLCIDGRFGLAKAEYAAIIHMGALAKNNIQCYTGFKLYHVRGRRTGTETPYFTWGSCS